MAKPIEMLSGGGVWNAYDGSTEEAEANYQRTGMPYATHHGYCDIPEIGRIDCVQLNTGARLILRTPGSLLDQMLTEIGFEEASGETSVSACEVEHSRQNQNTTPTEAA